MVRKMTVKWKKAEQYFLKYYFKDLPEEPILIPAACWKEQRKMTFPIDSVSWAPL